MQTPHDRLSAARAKLGLTLRDFAQPIGVSHQAVYKWEKGATPISRTAAKAIEDSYGISRLWLLDGTGRKSVNKDDTDAKERIMTARWLSGLRWHKFFESIGLPFQTFEEWMDKGEYTKPVLDAIESVYNVSPAWLQTGAEPMVSLPNVNALPTIKGQGNSQPSIKGDSLAQWEVPVFAIVASSNSDGSLSESVQRVDAIPISERLLDKYVPARQRDLFLLEVDWDNMSPSISPQDLVFVDSRIPRDFPREGVWLLSMDEALCIKRIQHLGPDEYLVANDNPKFPAVPYGKSIQAKGRVVGSFMKRH
ncbi:MAG: helix-turn-helix domain-containing protein [Holophagaceae bacterium]|nr:helix-turn-helix domain-containing protein [Holophagaceae bacterium]